MSSARSFFVGASVVQLPKWNLGLLLVPVFAGCLIFPRLGERDLWSSHEARAAQNGQFILDTRHFGQLRLFDGTPDYQKPPLYYWLVAGAAWLRGSPVDAAAVRLPSAISGWLIIVSIIAFLTQRGRPRAAWIAGLVLATTHHFLTASRTGRIDLPLTLTMTLALIFAIESQPWAAGVCLGLSLLLKGPIGVVIFASTLLVNRRAFLRPVVVGSALALPWYVAVGIESNWDYWREFFWHHNFQRANGSASDLASHPIWFYPFRALIDLVPWSLILIGGIAVWVWKRPQIAVDRERGFACQWILVTIVILSASAFKRADYLLLAYPAIAIVLGCWLEKVQLRYWHLVAICAVVAGNVCYHFVYLPWQETRFEKKPVANLIRASVGSGEHVVFFRVEDHLLAWHVGKPIVTVREWENLDWWVQQHPTISVVMPDCEIANCPTKLRQILRLPDTTDRKRPRHMALMKAEPIDGTFAQFDPR